MRRLGAIVLLVLALGAGPAPARGIGFQQLRIAGDGGPITIGVWYPTDAPTSSQPLGGFTQDVAPGGSVAGERLPLVVLSHGTGGWFGEHIDTALALARAGFVVAALSHPGDTYDDQSRAAKIWMRPAQLRRLVDYMLAEWPDRARIDPARIGAFGFSAGGFTVLAAVGGVPDLGLVRPHCATHPAAFECGVVRGESATPVLPPRSTWARDDRIRAAVVAAPALGYAFDLTQVTVPIQLWRAEDDSLLPAPDYADFVRKALPRPPEYHVVANADHMDFLAPCTPTIQKAAPQICRERPGFDRVAFHQDFDDAVVRFFRSELR